ncbi:MAG: mycofactocin biosynthesis chaperone MftB [Rhodospirillales bacterium]
MNLDDYYRLADGIAVRPERFGGLAYSYHDRRLYFIHSHGLAAFAGGLDGTRSWVRRSASSAESMTSARTRRTRSCDRWRCWKGWGLSLRRQPERPASRERNGNCRQCPGAQQLGAPIPCAPM